MSEEHMQEVTDAMLVTRALADDTQAFRLLIERYQTMALVLVLRYTGNREIARELVQEALLQAYLSLHRLRDPARFKSWFYGIVLNLCRSWMRAQANEPEMQDLQLSHGELLEADPQQIVEEHELRRVLREAVAVLSPNNRDVALLFYYEDRSIQSIASLLHISPTAVRNRLLKGREQLRAHLRAVYPDMPVATPRHYRRTTMIPMIVARVQQQERLLRTTVVLVDKPRQQALSLWFMTERDFSSQMRMFTSTQQKAAAAEPLTTDFIMSILQTLHGTLEGVEIVTLQADILYARVKLRGPDGVQQRIKARLENALPLAIESRCPIDVAEDVLERQGIKLVEFGETFEQQLDAVVLQAQQAFHLGTSQAISAGKAPRNLDFADDFRGWSFMGYPDTPKRYEYQLDAAMAYQKKTSLAITLREGEHSAEETFPHSFVFLMHEGFMADDYHGKRLRMVAYARAEEVKQGVFNLHINGPASVREGMERKTMYMTSNQHEPIEGTNDWRRYELVIDVPEDATSIQCGFNLTGSGKIWLDGFQFEAVDASVPLTGTRIVPPPRQPVNLAFEHNFDGWMIAGSSPQDYTRGIESPHAAFLKNAVEQPRGNIVLQQIVNAYDYRGRTVRLSATVRAEGVTQQASLYLAHGVTSNTRMERTIQGTADWQTYDITLSIPDESGQIEFGLVLYGLGQIWLRDTQFLTLQENGKAQKKSSEG
jgi:RNA polymerase sigma factor (sigma-70 family)